jgi:mono/diheme cytochrome c family protein
MPAGEGAIGAGTYPALAGDPNLAAAGYPVTVVLHGLRGMPPVGYFMTDDQVAAVVNYVRMHFGNNYPDTVTAADVKAVRK